MKGISEASLKKARERLKEETPYDYLIEPTKHAAAYAEDIPELTKLLQADAVKVIAEAFETANERAVERQSKYRKYASWANRLVAMTAVLGASVTAAVTLSGQAGENMQNILVPVLSMLAALTAAAAAFLLNLLNGARYLRRWMEARAMAETERLAYFKMVTSPQKITEGTVDPGVYLLSFWYFLRHQYRVQTKYYSDRSRDCESSANRSLLLAAAAAALAMLSSLLVPALSATIGIWVALFGIVTVLGTALSGYATARESMNQDQRNAERYERTGHILTKLGARIGQVEAAIGRGNVAVLSDFVDAVHEQLSLEHRQWLEAAEGATAAVQRLDEVLRAETGSLQEM